MNLSDLGLWRTNELAPTSPLSSGAEEAPLVVSEGGEGAAFSDATPIVVDVVVVSFSCPLGFFFLLGLGLAAGKRRARACVLTAPERKREKTRGREREREREQSRNGSLEKKEISDFPSLFGTLSRNEKTETTMASVAVAGKQEEQRSPPRPARSPQGASPPLSPSHAWTYSPLRADQVSFCEETAEERGEIDFF